ncbi:hypothetical protein BDN72DRAFT_864568 [Pluteus cervinus]|uniref:Uncharacterized protein n=1 Tax=Pluteus cervinus TaxID=181527 RepID=A0ACD3A5R0_9AGAR|nr:hypothetical protein BDN72DRAFT_864568 [Pluteus cervinus]
MTWRSNQCRAAGNREIAICSSVLVALICAFWWKTWTHSSESRWRNVQRLLPVFGSRFGFQHTSAQEHFEAVLRTKSTPRVSIILYNCLQPNQFILHIAVDLPNMSHSDSTTPLLEPPLFNEATTSPSGIASIYRPFINCFLATPTDSSPFHLLAYPTWSNLDLPLLKINRNRNFKGIEPPTVMRFTSIPHDAVVIPQQFARHTHIYALQLWRRWVNFTSKATMTVNEHIRVLAPGPLQIGSTMSCVAFHDHDHCKLRITLNFAWPLSNTHDPLTNVTKTWIWIPEFKLVR